MGTGEVLLRGLMAGAAGVAAMTLGENIEQTFTVRPNSYVPAHTLERVLNWTMHWGQGVLLGAVRALMAKRGVRGPAASFMFLNLRFAQQPDIGKVGAPPWTWPYDEQAIDILHKAVHAFVTGAVADAIVPPPPGDERVKDAHYYSDASAQMATEEACRAVFARYGIAGSTPVPEAEFLLQKRRHLLKVAVSRHLDGHPAASPALKKLRFWLRDNFWPGRPNAP